MITLRPAAERGHANHGWLDSHHSFSFADYHDPEHMGFGPLRVINEDRVQPGMGTGSVIVPGDVQRMSAGRGVLHSEFNPSTTDPVHFLQIWIEPATRGVPASYEQARVEAAAKRGKFALLAAPHGEGGAVAIHQDARVYAGMFDGAESATHALAPGRRAYVHVARGNVTVNDTELGAGDAVRIEVESAARFTSGRDAEILLFDLP